MIPPKGCLTLRGWKRDMPSSPGVVTGAVSGWEWSWGEEELDWRDCRILTLYFRGGPISSGQDGRIITKPGTFPRWSQLSECSPDLHPQHQGGMSLYPSPRHCAQCQRLDWHLQGISEPSFGSDLWAMGWLE